MDVLRFFQISRKNVCEKPGTYFKNPFIKIEIWRMKTMLKAFAWIVATDPYHYPPPSLTKVSKIFGTHSWKSAMNIIGTQDFAGARWPSWP